MKYINISAQVISILALLSCCNEKSMKLKLSRELDKPNILAAISLIENPCLSKIPEIGVTKSMLLYKLGIDEKNKHRKKAIMKEATNLLLNEAENGSGAARIILDGYNKEGEAYFQRFPWGDLLGKGFQQGQRPLP